MIMQRRFLAEPNLTLQRQEIALGMEMAARNAREIQQSETYPPVAGSVQYMKHRSARSYHQKPKRSDSTKNQSQARESKKCWRCKGYHGPEVCKFKDAEC